MITERDIKNAIDECHAVENPTADTCRKLASYYIIQDHMSVSEQPSKRSEYSYASNVDAITHIDSDTEFANVINELDIIKVLKVMDELMTVVQAIQPRLYASVIKKLKA